MLDRYCWCMSVTRQDNTRIQACEYKQSDYRQLLNSVASKLTCAVKGYLHDNIQYVYW